ncbi:MAG: tetrathionate reductase family octaheme c-type cytochrome [Thermodesulfobacteriota bacterium]
MMRVILALALGLCLAVGAALAAPAPPKFGDAANPSNTADHAKFAELNKTFATPMDVTRACLTCHTEAAAQVQKTLHWTWLCPAAAPEAGLGKAGMVVNNFCISILSNEPRCTSCHAGYGWKDKSFDFSASDRVDCLVCHEQTGSYKKFPAGAGLPVAEEKEFMGKVWTPPDLGAVARSVGLPTRKNCGVCHFFGGGGEGVKHGDLDASLMSPGKDLDVHMAVDGENFTCTRCHTTVAHSVAGRCYKTTSEADQRDLLDNDRIKRITCWSCHGDRPHPEGSKANDHLDTVACQTCHIPYFARQNSTKMSWDWSTAGKKKPDGSDIVEMKDGRPSYDTKKGSFVWEKNVMPEYMWYDGRLTYVTLKDKIDPSGRVFMNPPSGSYGEKNARIFPFKVHRGRQPYDAGNNTFVAPHLFPTKGKEDGSAYWKNYDWEKAVEAGMDYAGLPWSGKLGWVDTKYLFQTTHMVAPKDKALSCEACHVRENGRLADLTGFYMPGRDRFGALDLAGLILIILCLAGVAVHGVLRIAGRK